MIDYKKIKKQSKQIVKMIMKSKENTSFLQSLLETFNILLHKNLPKNFRKHIKKTSWKCPFCGSDSLCGEAFDMQDNIMVSQNVFCSECGKSWTDEYILFNVVENDE
jgi:hypothetical protein